MKTGLISFKTKLDLAKTKSGNEIEIAWLPYFWFAVDFHQSDSKLCWLQMRLLFAQFDTCSITVYSIIFRIALVLPELH